MADKTLSSLPRILSDGLLGNLMGTSPPTKSTSGSGVTRGFEIFIQNVNKRMTVYEEEQTIHRELQTIQQNFAQPGLSLIQMRDYLCRLVYCHMIGYNVSWGYIHALKLAQLGSHLDKKMGYLASCIFLQRDHQLVLLMMGTIQKDLSSSSILDNMAALSAASQLVPIDMIPMLVPPVLEKLKHSRDLVRQRAVMCLHQFQLRAPELLEHNQGDLQRALFDKDPGVMAAAVNIVYDNIQRDPIKHIELGESLLVILKQIVLRKMSKTYEYHTIPFPWLQIRIIRCLTVIAKVHDKTRRNLLSLTHQLIQRTNIRENMAYAILYECIQSILKLSPERLLVEEVASHVQRFITSSDPNLKFIGMKLLTSLVQTDERYAADYQDLILKSLDNPDISVQRKMHRLLFGIANHSNGMAVSSQLLQQLKVSTDTYWRSEVITMVINLAERFADPQQWQTDCLYSCLQLGAELITDDIVNKVILHLSKVYIRGEGSSQKRCQYLVQKSVNTLMSLHLSPAVIQLSAWVLGELCPLLKNLPEDKIVGLITKHLCNSDLCNTVHISLISALQKLVMQQVVRKETMATSLVECISVAQSVVIKQRLTLLLSVCRHDLKLPVPDTTAGYDTTLSFLDALVCQHLESGAQPYIPAHLRGQASAGSAPVEMDTSLYSIPDVETEGSEVRLRTTSVVSSTSSAPTVDDSQKPDTKQQEVKRIWSRQGRLDLDRHTPSPSNRPESLQEDSSDVKRHKELAKALFSGIEPMDKDSQFTPTSTSDSFAAIVTEDRGWRNLHSTMTHQDRVTMGTDGLSGLEDTGIVAGDSHSLPSNEAALTSPVNNLDGLSLDIGLCESTAKRGLDFDSNVSEGKTRIPTYQDSVYNEEEDEIVASQSMNVLSSTNDELNDSTFLNISVSPDNNNRISISQIEPSLFSTPSSNKSSHKVERTNPSMGFSNITYEFEQQGDSAIQDPDKSGREVNRAIPVIQKDSGHTEGSLYDGDQSVGSIYDEDGEDLPCSEPENNRLL